MEFCGTCGAIAEIGHRFCGECGQILSQAAPDPSLSTRSLGTNITESSSLLEKPSPQRTGLMFLILIGIALLVPFLMFWASRSGGNDRFAAALIRPSISEFKKLGTGQGNFLLGYQGLNKAANATSVVSRFGKPLKSEDLGDFYNSKLLMFKAKDEFGNSCLAALQFINACQNRNQSLDCYRLIAVQTIADE